MISLVQTHASIFDAVCEDEVGLRFAIVGSRRLRTAFQVVYSHGGDRLAPAMLRASVDITSAEAWARQQHIGRLHTSDDLIDRLGALLAVGNYRNADIRDLQLYLDLPCGAYPRPGELAADIRHLVRRADELECLPEQVVCELPSRLAEFETLQATARVLRRYGAKIALAHSRPDDPLSLWIERLRPDYVRMSGDWFTRVASHHASRQLLGSLVRAIRDSGAKVLFEWLDSQRLLALK